jgi:hypothetical protein
MQKCLLQEKECQASLINYRKDGGAFINLVTVIPVAAEDASDEITHHVGFQVDLAEQPNAILQKLRDGSYIVNYSSSASPSQFAGAYGAGRERRARGVSQDMVDILRGRRPWVQGQAAEPGAKPTRDHERAELHAMLLENTDGGYRFPRTRSAPLISPQTLSMSSRSRAPCCTSRLPCSACSGTIPQSSSANPSQTYATPPT